MVFGHDSGASAAAHLGADAAAPPGGACGADTWGLSSLGGGPGGRASADGHGGAGGAGQWGSSSIRARINTKIKHQCRRRLFGGPNGGERLDDGVHRGRTCQTPFQRLKHPPLSCAMVLPRGCTTQAGKTGKTGTHTHGGTVFQGRVKAEDHRPGLLRQGHRAEGAGLPPALAYVRIAPPTPGLHNGARLRVVPAPGALLGRFSTPPPSAQDQT